MSDRSSRAQKRRTAMKSGSGLPVRAIRLVAVIGVSLCGSAAAAQAQCEAARHTVVAVPVYDRPPEFSTANGWVLGQVNATLPAGATIQVCERRRIGFVIGAKTWLFIRTDGGSAAGWISAEAVASTRTTSPTLAAWFGPTNLYAQTPGVSAGEPLGLPGVGRWLFQVWAFFGILLGMAAKTLFDPLQRGSVLVPRDCLIRAVPALLVSPMVFLTLTSLGDGV